MYYTNHLFASINHYYFEPIKDIKLPVTVALAGRNSYRWFYYASNSLETGMPRTSAIENSVSIDTPKARVGLSTFARCDHEIPTFSAKAS